ncbi:transketolase [Moorella thermoacetica]|uniref:Transketolase n=1 Tax=Neomoorella thermoacetica TaxID=1525 RepID=A0A1J5JTR4_NEOTH|nr:transketolase [Moorella thermoacetica]APC07423.1 transketolase [Moorella thermoacetica]OIQ07959.1 transketolase [Moorella thermoacetica]OIQ10704.1 transketolase [Moorella thermoacetica]
MEKDLQSLMATARRIRRDIVRMVGAAGSGHPGGSLSAVEIMTALYFKVMRLDPERPDWPERDRFVLSKGHAAPVLYAALAERGFFAVDKLDTLRRLGSPLQGHPDRKSLPGVEVSTGSLGHGLAVANGMALAGRLDGRDYRVYVLLGDGELEEGMVWEGAMAAAHYRLDNLTAIVDHNHLQIDGRVEEVMSPEPVADKFRAFGWEVMTIDGHDFGQILDALERAREVKGKPTVIIAETIKGKGVSFMENQAGWHGKAPKPEEVEKALAELA